LQEELAQQGAALRGEIAVVRTDLKSGMQEGFATIRQEMAANRSVARGFSPASAGLRACATTGF